MIEVGIPPASAQTCLRLMQSKNDVLSDEMFPRGAARCQVSLFAEENEFQAFYWNLPY